MHDNCDQFIQAMKMRLATMVEPDIASEIIEAMTYELRDYDLTRKSTEIVPYCDDNEKAVKSYLACLIVEGKSKGTVKQYGRSLKKLFEFCGNKQYNLISQRDILAWLASLKMSGNKPTTVKNQRSNISSFFSWMFNNGFTIQNDRWDDCPHISKYFRMVTDARSVLYHSVASALSDYLWSPKSLIIHPIMGSANNATK